jgi:hypothetical protein
LNKLNLAASTSISQMAGTQTDIDTIVNLSDGTNIIPMHVDWRELVQGGNDPNLASTLDLTEKGFAMYKHVHARTEH